MPKVEQFFGYNERKYSYETEYAHKKAIAFAKIHVRLALEEAAKVLEVNADADYIEHPTVERILNSYPLDNIR